MFAGGDTRVGEESVNGRMGFAKVKVGSRSEKE